MIKSLAMSRKTEIQVWYVILVAMVWPSHAEISSERRINGNSDDCTISVGTARHEPSDVYPNRHYCSSCDNQLSSRLCANLNRLVLPDYGMGKDPFFIPRGGLWGGLTSDGGQGYSRGGMGAFKAALAHSYSIVEVDLVLIPGSTGDVEDDLMYSGAVYDMVEFGGMPGVTPSTLGHHVTDYFIRKPDQSRSTREGDRVTLFDDIVRWAYDNDVVLVVDSVLENDFADDAKDTAFRTMAAALYAAKEIDESALKNVILMSNYSYDDTVNGIGHYIEFDEYKRKFLWAPDISRAGPSIVADEYEVLTAQLNEIIDWNLNTGKSRSVAMYQLPLFSPGDPDTTLFTFIDPNSVKNIRLYTPRNIIEFVEQYTKNTGVVSRRASISTFAPLNSRGYNPYNNEFGGNVDGFDKFNPLTNVSFYYSEYLAYITNRPKLYRNILTGHSADLADLTDDPYPE